ncbi:NUDIX hydrolase [Candidatus Woesearchaeota archaeon]|nr:NUDIX hydrolase [Candidatus Woesearchaeota archaeon]
MTDKNPPTAVDLIIEVYDGRDMQGIVLIRRGHAPYENKWALPGGFQEWGESLEKTAVREGREETGLDLTLVEQLHAYSDPGRDPRGPVNSVGYVARAQGIPYGGDDAADARVFAVSRIPYPLAFDHDKRLEEYLQWRRRK